MDVKPLSFPVFLPTASQGVMIPWWPHTGLLIHIYYTPKGELEFIDVPIAPEETTVL